MLSTVLAWLGSLLGGPFATAAVNAYKAKLQSENSSDKIAADLAAKAAEIDLARERLEQETVRADEGRWWISPRWIIELSAAIYVSKVWVYDAAFHRGVTDALNPAMGSALDLVLAFMFGHSAVALIGRAIARRP